MPFKAEDVTAMLSSCFIISIIILALTGLLVVCLRTRTSRSARTLTPVRMTLVGTFLAAVVLHYPVYWLNFSGDVFGWLQTTMAALHHALRLFVLDGDLESIQLTVAALTIGDSGLLGQWYLLLTTVIYILGPILTFSVVLSFFKNIQAYRRLLFHMFSQTYIFSELNESSLALAASLKRNHPRCLLVFTDVYEVEEEEISELCDQARVLGAICFKCDIAALNLELHRKTNRISCFAIGVDEDENIRQSLALVHKYGAYANMSLYIFSTGVESELLFQDVSGRGMLIRRINSRRALVSQLMYQHGAQLFENAIPGEPHKQIRALILGLGGYGTEMLKALAWCGQMDGYRLTVHAFDSRLNASCHFAGECPELMSADRNGVEEEGESFYHIVIHDNVDVASSLFEEALLKTGPISHVFISLGNDSLNIKTAVKLREFCERQGYDPCIQAVVYDAYKAAHLADIHNFKGKPYRISFVGNLDISFSEQMLLNSELEQCALKRHMSYGGPVSDFWSYEYNYRSSTASAIHQKLRIQCGIPGADKPVGERTVEERDALALLEHKRWNAYMRSEGYRFSGSMDPATRNDLGKVHNFLVPFEALPEREKRKDDI